MKNGFSAHSLHFDAFERIPVIDREFYMDLFLCFGLSGSSHFASTIDIRFVRDTMLFGSINFFALFSRRFGLFFVLLLADFGDDFRIVGLLGLVTLGERRSCHGQDHDQRQEERDKPFHFH